MMVQYTLYFTATGEIAGHGSVAIHDVGMTTQQSGVSTLWGVRGDEGRHRVDLEALAVAQPAIEAALGSLLMSRSTEAVEAVRAAAAPALVELEPAE